MQDSEVIRGDYDHFMSCSVWIYLILYWVFFFIVSLKEAFLISQVVNILPFILTWFFLSHKKKYLLALHIQFMLALLSMWPIIMLNGISQTYQSYDFTHTWNTKPKVTNEQDQQKLRDADKRFSGYQSGVEVDKGKGDKCRVTEGGLTFGGECTTQCTDDVSLNVCSKPT